jgi:hypothetical protein
MPEDLNPIVRTALRVNRVVQYLSRDAFGGPRVLKLAWVINAHKAGTAPFIAGLMWWYGNTTIAAWVYLGLHGSYGLSWLIKDMALPDRGWQQRVTFGGAAMSFLLVLGPYWVMPWLLVSGVLGPGHPQPTAALMAACIVLFTIGVTLMLGADARKKEQGRAASGLRGRRVQPLADRSQSHTRDTDLKSSAIDAICCTCRRACRARKYTH